MCPAVGVDLDPGDILHGEVGPPVGGVPRVVDLGDSGVIQAGQSFPFQFETSQDLSGGEAGLDQLQGDTPVNRFPLLRLEDLPHPPLADLLEKVEGSHDVVGRIAWFDGSGGPATQHQ
jgi:hypothetical protein